MNSVGFFLLVHLFFCASSIDEDPDTSEDSSPNDDPLRNKTRISSDSGQDVWAEILERSIEKEYQFNGENGGHDSEHNGDGTEQSGSSELTNLATKKPRTTMKPERDEGNDNFDCKRNGHKCRSRQMCPIWLAKTDYTCLRNKICCEKFPHYKSESWDVSLDDL